MIKDKYILDKNLDLSCTKCYACNLKSHTIEFCPRLLFLPDRLFIIQRHIYSEPTRCRILCKRRNKPSPNARSNILTISKEIQKFIINLEKIGMEEDFDDSYNSQKSDSLSLIFEDEFKENLNKEFEFEKRKENFQEKKDEDLNANRKEENSLLTFEKINSSSDLKPFAARIEELLGVPQESIKQMREDGIMLSDETPHASKGRIFKTKGKDSLEVTNLNSNPHLIFHRNSFKRVSRKEETRKGGESPNKRSRHREIMNGEEVGIRPEFILNEIPWKSETNWSFERVEMGRNPNKRDSKINSLRFGNFKEDLIFRFFF